MGKLPVREIAAAAAGMLFVWAWQRRQRPRFLAMNPLPPVAVDMPPVPATQLAMPPEIEAMFMQMMAQFERPPTRPEPLRDMAFVVNPEQNSILIAVANPFAAAWITQEAPAFGGLIEPYQRGGPGEYVLLVNKTYDAIAVANWLSRGWAVKHTGGDDGRASVDSPG